MPVLKLKDNRTFIPPNFGGVVISQCIVKVSRVRFLEDFLDFLVLAYWDKNSDNYFWSFPVHLEGEILENYSLLLSPDSLDLMVEREKILLQYLLDNPVLLDTRASSPPYNNPFDLLTERYKVKFNNTSLVSSVLTVIHKLGATNLRIVVKDNDNIVIIKKGGNNEILPNLVTITNNNRFTIDFTTLLPITNTWRVIVTNTDL